jgi:hypothetical protein
MLTWTNCHGEIISNGPLWDMMATSSDASGTSTVAGATEEDDNNNVVAVAEEDWEMPTTDVNVVDNIKGVDNTQEVYEVWNEDVPVDVDNQINNDVKVVTKSASGGVMTTKWDQPLKVIPKVTDATKVSSMDTGRTTRGRKPPNPFIPSWTGKKYGYAMTQIVKLDGDTV